jgi:hypothetical protein
MAKRQKYKRTNNDLQNIHIKQDMTVTGCCYQKSPKRRRFFPPCFGSHFENGGNFEDAYLLHLRNYWAEFHETWWRYRYMFLVGPKVFSFVVKGIKVIF